MSGLEPALIGPIIGAISGGASTTANILAGKSQQSKQEELAAKSRLQPQGGGPVQGIQAPPQDVMAMLMQLAQSGGAGQINPRV